MKYLLSLLFLLFTIFPAAAMPVLVDTGNLANWEVKDNDDQATRFRVAIDNKEKVRSVGGTKGQSLVKS